VRRAVVTRALVTLAIAAGIALSVTAGGCKAIDPFHCERDEQCGSGRCEPAGACSFSDDGCASGWRYGQSGAPELAGTCVGSAQNNGPDAGPDDPDAAIDTSHVAQVAAGSETTCARTDQGGLRCWGNNKYGGLARPGDGVDAPVPIASLDAVTDVDLGEFHTCALEGGLVYCWGADAQGELGRGDATDAPVPSIAVVTGLDHVTDIDLGEYHSCALTDAGAVWCWGRNKDGEIAQDLTGYQWHPVSVPVPAARSIAAGGQEGCAIAMTGTDVYCWGKNDVGQVGVAIAARVKPVLVPGFAGATQISIGGDHACAVFGDGRVACTGLNDRGQLGDNSKTNRAAPVTVMGLADAVEVASLDHATCARKQDGSVVCWGEGDHGELGAGTADALVPGDPVPLGAAAVQLTAGESFACARTGDGCLSCWGDDAAGQLGDGPAMPGGVRPVHLGACAP
jgi:alpha-tubulin suppressor-like RCC1 family protein